MTKLNFNQDIEREVDRGILVNEGRRLIFKAKSEAIGLEIENKRGSNCSLSDGVQNRVLTLSNTSLSSNELIWINGLMLHTADYTINHLSSSTTITFINFVFDSDYIKIQYLQ